MEKIMLAGNGQKTKIKQAHQKDKEDAEVAAVQFAEWLYGNTSWPYFGKLKSTMIKLDK